MVILRLKPMPQQGRLERGVTTRFRKKKLSEARMQTHQKRREYGFLGTLPEVAEHGHEEFRRILDWQNHSPLHGYFQVGFFVGGSDRQRKEVL
jgi:hypothetical protein